MDILKKLYYSIKNQCVFLIQRWWRLKIHIRAARQIVPSLREKFHFFFYQSNSVYLKATTSTEKLFAFVKNKNLKYFAFNLCDNAICQQLVKQQRLNQDPLPLIFINKVYIGSMDQLQYLIDFQLIDQILNEEYLKHCLVCKASRESLENEKCQNCQRNYLFFEMKTQ